MPDDGPLVVVYDRGSASAGEVGVGLADLGPLLFLTPPSPHVDAMKTVLGQLAEVVVLDADAPRRVAHRRPRGILTFSESMLRTTAALAATLGLPCHTPDTAALLTDKARQRQRLRQAGVDSVRSRPVTTPAQFWEALAACGLPAVVKPAHGQGSRDTFRVSDEQAAEETVRRIFPDRPASPTPVWVVEELLPGRPSLPFGDYVSVETACDADGSIVPLAVTGKHPLLEPFRETGQFWPSHLPEDEQRQVIDLATAAVRALGVTSGICHTEIKLTPSGPRLIEVNGRLGGHLNELARRSCGVDLVRTAGLLALGRPLPHGRLRPDRVYFQYNTPAPVEACQLRGVRGAREVRAVDGVTGYRVYARPGEHLAGGVRTHHIDLLCGDADDHQEMVRILNRALARLRYDFTSEGRTWTSVPTPIPTPR
jgi:biotin carboxylase